jgi:hypothetical protein
MQAASGRIRPTSYATVFHPTKVKQASYQVASAATPAKVEGPAAGSAVVNHHQMLALLRESAYAETREWAADNLVHFNWKISPEIAATLISSACHDKAASVRVACIHCMVKMNIKTAAAMAALKSRKTDEDPRVRMESEKAMRALSSSPVASAR